LLLAGVPAGGGVVVEVGAGLSGVSLASAFFGGWWANDVGCRAQILDTVLTVILSLRSPLNITGYNHFCLRDADTDEPESLYYAFGLLHTDYTPKPAFAVYQAACRV
jgi:hypothetical protein